MPRTSEARPLRAVQMVGAFAEFERSMTGERTRADFEWARANGRTGGRQRILSAHQHATAMELIDSGTKYRHESPGVQFLGDTRELPPTRA